MIYHYTILHTNDHSREIECVGPMAPDMKTGFIVFPMSGDKAVLVHPDHVLAIEVEIKR